MSLLSSFHLKQKHFGGLVLVAKKMHLKQP